MYKIINIKKFLHILCIVYEEKKPHQILLLNIYKIFQIFKIFLSYFLIKILYINITYNI